MLRVIILFLCMPLLTDLAFGERSANPVYVISVMQEQTPLGDITIELFPDKAPLQIGRAHV